MIALIVVGVLILVVVVVFGLWMFFHRKSRDNVLPSELLNHDIEMVLINRSNHTELPASGESIDNDNSGVNSSSDFVFEPDLEEVQV
jgi:FtsZ-interacting cell division protein ZipA